MERILYDRKTVDVDSKQKMVLEYYLIEEELAVEYCELKSYGVEIQKTAHFTDEHTERECKRISNLFFSRKDTEHFLDKIVKNTVTPIALKNVVDDYADGYVRMTIPIQA